MLKIPFLFNGLNKNGIFFVSSLNNMVPLQKKGITLTIIETITDSYGDIEVIPVWKWLLKAYSRNLVQTIF